MKKGKKRKAPRPPNPFTGKVEADEEEDKGKNPFNDEEPDPSEVSNNNLHNNVYQIWKQRYLIKYNNDYFVIRASSIKRCGTIYK